MSRLLKVYERTRYGSKLHLIRVDNEDYSKLISYPWNWSLTNKGTKKCIRSAVDSDGQKKVYLGRFIMNLPIRDPRRVYHKNGNFSDFRKNNLLVK